MGCVLVFDDYKHCFRKLDKTNYNDDIVVGTIFFNRKAINVITKYYRIIGYILCDENDVFYPIDIRENDIALLEGTYNCLAEKLKEELIPFNIQAEPKIIWSSFFFRWQFLCDWNVFDKCGSFIKLASIIIGNEVLKKRLITERIDLILPSDYKELSNMVCSLKKLFNIEFYDKRYYEDVNYLFDSLINGYHINMTSEEIDTYCYQLCDYVEKKVGRENV